MKPTIQELDAAIEVKELYIDHLKKCLKIESEVEWYEAPYGS